MGSLLESVVMSILAFAGVFLVLFVLMGAIKCLRYVDVLAEKGKKSESETESTAANHKQ